MLYQTTIKVPINFYICDPAPPNEAKVAHKGSEIMAMKNSQNHQNRVLSRNSSQGYVIFNIQWDI